LSVAAEITVAKVVGQDIDKVGPFRDGDAGKEESNDEENLHDLTILEVKVPAGKSAKKEFIIPHGIPGRRI